MLFEVQTCTKIKKSMDFFFNFMLHNDFTKIWKLFIICLIGDNEFEKVCMYNLD